MSDYGRLTRMLASMLGLLFGLLCVLGGIAGLSVYAGLTAMWEIPPREPAILAISILCLLAGILILAYLYFRTKQVPAKLQISRGLLLVILGVYVVSVSLFAFFEPVVVWGDWPGSYRLGLTIIGLVTGGSLIHYGYRLGKYGHFFSS